MVTKSLIAAIFLIIGSLVTTVSAQPFYGPETLDDLFNQQGVTGVRIFVNNLLQARTIQVRVNDSQAAKIHATFWNEQLFAISQLPNTVIKLAVSIALNGPNGLIHHDGSWTPDPLNLYPNNSDVIFTIHHLMSFGGFWSLQHSMEMVNAIVDWQQGNFYPINNWSMYSAQGMYRWIIGSDKYYLITVVNPTLYECCPVDNDPWDYDYYGPF